MATKAVTWADGSTDVLEITQTGQVFLNGAETVAFGFHWVILNNHGPAALKVLDTLQSWGIRFISFDLSSWFTMAQLQAEVDYWFPQFYARKMFVEYAMQEHPAGDLDTAGQTAAFTQMVGLIANSANPALFGSMIYAATYAWEFDLAQFAHTADQNLGYVQTMTPVIKGLLQNSPIGSVPLLTKIVSPYGSGIPLFQYCDLVGYDYYTIPGQLPAHADERFSNYRSYCSQAGKTGYRIWLQENGVQQSQGGNPTYTPAAFQYVIGGAGMGDVSEAMIWVAMWDTDDLGVYNYQAFNLAGDPYPWILALRSYFPVPMEQRNLTVSSSPPGMIFTVRKVADALP